MSVNSLFFYGLALLRSLCSPLSWQKVPIILARFMIAVIVVLKLNRILPDECKSTLRKVTHTCPMRACDLVNGLFNMTVEIFSYLPTNA